jgi:hypothetical protein
LDFGGRGRSVSYTHHGYIPVPMPVQLLTTRQELFERRFR